MKTMEEWLGLSPVDVFAAAESHPGWRRHHPYRILSLRYNSEGEQIRTHREMAEMLGVSLGRVNQLLDKSRRTVLHRHTLRDFYRRQARGQT